MPAKTFKALVARGWIEGATRQQDADLTAALEAYQAAVDAGDEVLEIEMMEAAE